MILQASIREREKRHAPHVACRRQFAMNARLDWSVGQRLGLGFAAIAAVLAVFAVMLYKWQGASEDAQRAFVDRIAPRAEAAARLERSLLAVGIDVRSYLIAPDDARRDDALASIEQTRRTLRTLGAAARDEDESRAWAGLEQAVEDYLARASDAVNAVSALRNAAMLERGVENARHTADEHLHALQQLLGAKSMAAVGAMNNARAKVSGGMATAFMLVLAAFAVLAFFTIESIRRPTRALLRAASEMERGQWKPALRLSAQAWEARGEVVPKRNEVARIGLALGSAAQALEQRELRLRADARIAAATSSLEGGPMAEAALNTMVEATRSAIGAIFWNDAAAGVLRPIATHALSNAQALAAGEGLPGEAVHQQRPIVLHDLPQDGPFRVRLGVGQCVPRCIAAVPIALRGELLGVAVLGSLHEIGADAIEFLSAACLQVAIGLKNVRSHEKMQTLVAELRESHERIERQARELTKADEHKNEFLGLLAHELRNPLAAISHSAFILGRPEKTQADDARARAVIGRQMRHLTRMVDDLLDVTRIARGKVRLQREVHDVAQVVREALNDWQGTLQQAGLVLEADVPDTPVYVDGDRTRIAQVVGNLLSNAVKFTERGRRVTVALRASAQAQHVELEVADEGIGIDVELAERLFEPFSQGEAGLARGNGGLGLGLALAKALVELHGGTIAVDSEGPGRGARFVVTLPLSAAVPKPSEPARIAAAGRPRHILLVEDNVDAAETLCTALRYEGHEVEVAHDGLAGLERARAARPDVVLCDIGIPGIDGYEFARRARREESLAGTTLVALSGYASAEDHKRSLAAGFHRHLSKPVDLERLFGFLAELERSPPQRPASPRPTLHESA